MEMGVDEARHHDAAGDVDLLDALIALQRSDNRLAADGDVALAQFTGDEIVEPSALQDDIGFRLALSLVDAVGEAAGHGEAPFESLSRTIAKRPALPPAA